MEFTQMQCGCPWYHLKCVWGWDSSNVDAFGSGDLLGIIVIHLILLYSFFFQSCSLSLSHTLFNHQKKGISSSILPLRISWRLLQLVLMIQKLTWCFPRKLLIWTMHIWLNSLWLLKQQICYAWFLISLRK